MTVWLEIKSTSLICYPILVISNAYCELLSKSAQSGNSFKSADAKKPTQQKVFKLPGSAKAGDMKELQVPMLSICIYNR